MALLEVKNLRVEFPTRHGTLLALDDISFNIEPGEILGVVEDRSDRGEDRPSPFTIMISVRVGKLLDVVKSDGLANMFPGGTEESFAAEKDVSERVTVAGKAGYSLIMASHGEFEQVVFAGLGDAWTLVIRCDFVGEAAKPRVPVAEQIDACDKVVSTLALEI